MNRDPEENPGEVGGGFLGLTLQLDGTPEPTGGENDGRGHFGEAQSVHVIEIQIEIERQRLEGCVRDGADGSAADARLGADLANGCGFHFNGVGSGLLTQDSLILRCPDDAVGAVKTRRASTGTLEGLGEWEIRIGLEENRARPEGGVESTGEAAGEDQMWGDGRE
jgi:hypothetical protein